ncbi:hypothetical protein ASE14_08175 [Agromyces sp. Root81]|uniref:hypothetical protein n=1 Tax=Agromyces sp. Root81 TaxID=1736601 RepID=UPI0006F89CC5|nr:hypothetical protein [Agromyces sp. Root81]KRC60927.1 hypothetical protein ASE14_08175 [Agromyces sp. Root81]
MKRLLPIAAAALLLAGCSSAPPRQEVVDRFLIELDAATDGLLTADTPMIAELAEGVADNALDGMCGSDPYRVGLEDPSLVYAFDVTCLTYFEGDMTKAQVDAVKDAITQRVAEDATDVG